MRFSSVQVKLSIVAVFAFVAVLSISNSLFAQQPGEMNPVNGANSEIVADTESQPESVDRPKSPNNARVFTGISKPLPGELRFVPGTVEKPKRPIPGTAVHPVIPSAWYPYSSRVRIDAPLNGSLVPTLPEDQSGGTIPIPVLAPPAPKTERKYANPGEDPSFELGPDRDSDLDLDSRLSVPGEEKESEDPFALYRGPNDYFGNEYPDETIYGIEPIPTPEDFHPVAGDPSIPLRNFLPPTGPPKALRYGLVNEEGILNAPYAPGQAAPKVYSNGREVTATERAQWAEGRAPIIRGTGVMAQHTHVATSLPKFTDGLEHCPVCCRAYFCGCGEENCRFCNPESRIGPPPVCSCCGDKRPCIHGDMCSAQLGHGPYREYGNTSGGIACPICKEAVERVPCGECEKCLRGETCELYKPCGECPSCLVYEKCDLYRAHRNCILPPRRNSCSRCDNTIEGEPCGSCDWCRENSDQIHEPCGHQEVGFWNEKTVYNPHNEPTLFSAPPRLLVDRFNNRASKFPVYYNPAPYYKDYSNPSTYTGFNRPFNSRYTCRLCSNQPCQCNAKGYAGQISFALACKFCNRNPCACTAEICNVNAEMNPVRVRARLEQLKEETKAPRPWEDLEQPGGTGTGAGFIPDEGPRTQRPPESVWDQQQQAPPGTGGGGNDRGLFNEKEEEKKEDERELTPWDELFKSEPTPPQSRAVPVRKGTSRQTQFSRSTGSPQMKNAVQGRMQSRSPSRNAAENLSTSRRTNATDRRNLDSGLPRETFVNYRSR